MFSFFGKKTARDIPTQQGGDFSYIPEGQYYFDSSCQSLRPQAVLDCMNEYFTTYNACGGRVKYKWGEEVDMRVEDTRKKVLQMSGKSQKDYDVAFTLNTTYGINLILSQLPGTYEAILTSDIEHNSTFLPTMAWAKKHHKKRIVLSRTENGSLPLDEIPESPVVVLVNAVSNIDGRICPNLEEAARKVKKHGGLVLIDGAQAFAHHDMLLRHVDADAIFGSSHKMYGPSLGFIIFKKELPAQIDFSFIGGGTVEDVSEDDFTLLRNEKEPYAVFEPGLQNWSGIIGLGAAIDWKRSQDYAYLKQCSEKMFEGLRAFPQVHIINHEVSSTISIYVDGLDSHQLALYLAAQGIMCRSGYFCCHYYLKHKLKLPPLLRISLGYHTKESDVEHFLKILTFILHSAL